MKRGTRKGPSRTRPAIVRRAWYTAHQEARAAGAPVLEAQMLAQHAARVAGASWTRRRRDRWRGEAIVELERRGAVNPRATPAPAPRRRDRTAAAIAGNTRFLERQHDPDVRARRAAIAERDRRRGKDLGDHPNAIAIGLQRATSAPNASGHEIWTAMLEQLRRDHLEAIAERKASLWGSVT